MEQRQAIDTPFAREAIDSESQLKVVLEHITGALIYTDRHMNIVCCNNNLIEMYGAPLDLLQPGEPYAAFLKWLAVRGYYGEGDVDALIADRLDGLRNPSGKSFEDHTPDGRIYRVWRRDAVDGGTVTVMTDVTDQKQAERAVLEGRRQAEQTNRKLATLSSKLSKYLSPQIYQSVFGRDQNVEMPSKRKKLTVFFSDIAAFTEATDDMEPEELTDVLNHYLSEMSGIAFRYGATIDKYIGDAMLLFFGDPETRGVKEDAETCVKMAISMQCRMRELEQEWRDRGLQRPFHVRMGISTGFCTVGNFGSHDRFDYTIIGREVNLAARLQSAAEPGSIFLSYETNALVKDVVLTEPQPPITLKGFARPINCYRIVDTYDELAKDDRVILREREGLRVLVDLTKQDRREAISILEEVLSRLKERLH
ncbi:PAS-domain containing protein [Microbaculum marinisediminis]|uniref:PAS-domain containing protein n=1 Tax=Microbaculum marinisediminis TaxID=2931392 RepID=A0AAW5QW55_9HYPH|nr:adenylate/guanylate cyclase domain-containing protein [Microbaculum sp. A6E488]MCT8970549.1 PAS-domain containing protein [Microbaculum sp. A6E488]